MLEDASRRRITLEASGVEIALLDWGGDGPLALLHHANGFCAATWALVAERLRPHFRVVAMDARGHGHSTKLADETAYAWPRFGEDAAAVARSLAADHPDGRIALGLGHSFGGTSLMLASAEVPDLFERLVLVDPVLPPPVVVETSIDPTRAERGRGLAEGATQRALPGRGRPSFATGIRVPSISTSPRRFAIARTAASSSAARLGPRRRSSSRAVASIPGRAPRA
jgi:pimeloyl-ACP methyl ester carboxylesterase